MAWVRYDDGFPRHPKVVRASKLIGGKFAKARLLGVHLEATCYCNKHATDGFIPDDVVNEELTSDPQAREILRICALPSIKLAHRVRGGWRLHDYDKYQPSKKEMEDSRAYERERKRRQRACPVSVPTGQIRDNGSVPDLSPHPSDPSDRIVDQDHRADARPVRGPDDNPKVLLRLAHQAIEREPLDAKTELKALAARYGILYDATACGQALDQAERQRQVRAVES